MKSHFLKTAEIVKLGMSYDFVAYTYRKIFRFIYMVFVVSATLSVNSAEKPPKFQYLSFFKSIDSFSTDSIEYDQTLNKWI